MRAINELKAFVSEVLSEAQGVAATRRENEMVEDTVDAQMFTKLQAEYRLLLKKLGPYAEVWSEALPQQYDDSVSAFERVYANLLAIQNAVEKGRLSTVEDLVAAEILSDILEQAEVLIAGKYYRPAAVLLRAVLEERLRKLCEANACLPTVAKPTIEAYKQALYSARIIDKLVVKKVDWMAGVGNSAAHNLPEYRDTDVPEFHRDLQAFLLRYSA